MRLPQRLRRDEDGAAAVIVAVMLVMLVGITGLAVDGTAVWTVRRELTRSTDAAALAGALAAKQAAESDCATRQAAAEAAARASVEANNAANGEEAVVYPGTGGVEVTCPGTRQTKISISAHVDHAVSFLAVLGLDDLDIASTSIAEAGPAVGGTLLPLALCVDAGNHYENWQAEDGYAVPPIYGETDAEGRPIHPTGYGTGAAMGTEYVDNGLTVHRVYFTKAVGSTNPGCNYTVEGGDGNWGYLDFDPPHGGSDELNDRIRNGFEGPVTVDPWRADDPDRPGVAFPDSPTPLSSPPPGWATQADCLTNNAGNDDCYPQTGANASTQNALDAITCPPNEPAATSRSDPTSACKWFGLLVYDAAYGPNANDMRLHPVDFIPVVMRDYNKVTGNENNQSYFDFEFLPFSTGDRICSASECIGKNVIMHLCGADQTDTGCDLP